MEQARFDQAVQEFERRVAAVAGDQWTAPTPCAEWDVRQLVNHVVGELLWMPPLLAGKTIEGVGDRFEGDILGDDPAATCQAAAADARAATAAPGALEREVHLSFGDTPASEYLGQVTSDLTIHAWDLACASGQDDQLDGGLVEAVYAFLAPQADGWRSAGVFGPAVDVGARAAPQARLLGLAGRNPAG